ncbi:TNFAIP3-interacting protein 2 isoform X2 [Halyomorpha halys]|uniref:TNFAIP3-interacting protein 2 isoform X2 n=1 Tax=Halyomorpha halys TaxID=286706 RepID=UPI0006D51479
MEMDPWIAEAVDSFLTSGRVSGLRGTLRSRVKSSETDMSDKYSTYEEMKEKLRMRQDEIFKLQAANSDLTQVNKRWHRYNSDMQMFIEKLQTTIRDQQEQINRILSSEERVPVTRETGECTRKSCSATRDEVKKLREKVKHLELQVKSHKEDWEAERAEKKSISEAKDELERRFSAALRDLYSAKIPQLGCRQRDVLFGNVVCDSSDDRDTVVTGTSTMVTGTSGVAASRSLGTLSVGIKSSSFIPVARSPSAPSTTHSETEDDISCPSCDKVFSSRVHLEFLDHFESCQSHRNGPD